MDLLTQTSLIVSVTSFALGFSTLARDVRNKLFLAFAMLCCAISAWAAFFFASQVWEIGLLYRAHLLLNAWLGPVSLVFIRVLLRLTDRWSRRLLDFSVVVSVALTIALFFQLERFEESVHQAVLFAPAVIVIQILRMMWIDWRVKHGLALLPKLPTVGLSRRRLIYAGALFVLLITSLDHVPRLGLVVPSIGNLCLTFYLFFISQAISQQRLLNFTALLSRILVLAFIALGLTLVYFMLIVWAPASPVLVFVNCFIISFALVMLLEPLRTFVRYVTQHMVTREHRLLEQTLRHAQQALTGMTRPDAVFESILTVAEQTLQPQRASLFVVRGDGTRHRRVLSRGPRPETEHVVSEVLATHPLLLHCEKLRQRGKLPVLLDQVLENEVDRSASRPTREELASLVIALKALGCNLLIPLIDAGRILGFVAMDAPAPPEPWGGNWGILPIVYPYFEQAAQTLRNMEVFARAREKDRLAALGEMAAGLAHEIRNPLGAIKGAAQLLTERPDQRFLGVIVEEVDRLNRVVTQFLDYSKPALPELRAVDPSQLVSRAVELLRPSLPDGVKLEFSGSRAPLRVLASPEQIHQVVLNLIQNSVNALHGRPRGKIRVSVEPDEGSEREVQILVEDDGPGIRPENIEKLFIPFFTTSPSGTGLGLSICQKIVEAHQGRIDVSSELGRYSRFAVVLPRASE